MVLWNAHYQLQLNSNLFCESCRKMWCRLIETCLFECLKFRTFELSINGTNFHTYTHTHLFLHISHKYDSSKFNRSLHASSTICFFNTYVMNSFFVLRLLDFHFDNSEQDLLKSLNGIDPLVS